MPYVVINPAGLSNYPRLADSAVLMCSFCGCHDFTPDMFNPYYTIPNELGWYTEYHLLQCGYCEKTHRISYSRNVKLDLPGEPSAG